MKRIQFFTGFCLLAATTFTSAQLPPPTPTEELRLTVQQWVATMKSIQQEENDWSRDQEVLTNYREGLEKEIVDLKEKIADAQTRKAGADSETLEQSAERDRYLKAKEELTKLVRSLEENLASKLPLIPAPLRSEPKVAQAIEDLERDLRLPADKRDEGVTKRLLNLINLTTEIEKFQQVVTLRPELRTNKEGREFNMQVLYFGLGAAYAVNEDATFALVGTPSADGWQFEEKSELAAQIKSMIAATTGDQDAAFFNLPFSKP